MAGVEYRGVGVGSKNNLVAACIWRFVEALLALSEWWMVGVTATFTNCLAFCGSIIGVEWVVGVTATFRRLLLS